MFSKRHDVGFFCKVYMTAYAKEFCIKSLGRLSDGWYFDLGWLMRPLLFCCLQSIWCKCTACWTSFWTWLVSKEWSSTGFHLRSLKERETLHHLSSTPQNTVQVLSKLWGNPVISAFLLHWNGKKKYFQKHWQIWLSSAIMGTKLPKCSLCNHMVQLLA